MGFGESVFLVGFYGFLVGCLKFCELMALVDGYAIVCRVSKNDRCDYGKGVVFIFVPEDPDFIFEGRLGEGFFDLILDFGVFFVFVHIC